MSSNISNLPYRDCVGIMLFNSDKQVFVGQRIDTRAEAWQMPQGGVDDDEDKEKAAFRELKEEIGTDKATIISVIDKPLKYDLPKDLVPKLWGGKYRGQSQYWYLMKFDGGDEDINIATPEPEFNSWRWVNPEALPEIIVPFKRELYQNLIDIFLPKLNSYP